MRPLVAIRRAAPYDPSFATRSPLFAPLARAAQTFDGLGDFSPVEDLARVFAGQAPVRFAAMRPRRRGEPLDPAQLYDAVITRDRVVPARERCWHDFMNALVWGTFPRAKHALHARQHQAIAKRIVPGARTLPPERTRELDALALVDEGGVVVLARGADALRSKFKLTRGAFVPELVQAGQAHVVVFGHAIYESLALGVPPTVVAATLLDDPRADEDEDLTAAVDAALARALGDAATFRSPDELTRVDLAPFR